MKRKLFASRVRITCWSPQRKRADDALDRLGSVNGVQRRKNKVAGFGGFKRDLNRFLVAHFADQNYFWSLAQRGAQSQRESRRVAVQLALVNDGFLVAMHEFDRIFDGEDVIRLAFR